MLTVWGRRDSSNVQPVMWCIAELGLTAERHDVGHRFGGTDTAEFIAMNPNRTVPVLRDGSNPPIWESGAILRYLATRYGRAPFWPEDAAARAEIDKWAEWAKVNIAIGFTQPVFWKMIRTPKADRDLADIQRGVAALEARLDIAEAVLADRPFLAADALTLADIQFAPTLHRYFDLEIERRPLPAIRRYFESLCERPAFRDNVRVSYDALRVD